MSQVAQILEQRLEHSKSEVESGATKRLCWLLVREGLCLGDRNPEQMGCGR